MTPNRGGVVMKQGRGSNIPQRSLLLHGLHLFKGLNIRILVVYPIKGRGVLTTRLH